MFDRFCLLSLVLAAGAIACGCVDQDPFGQSKRTVAGNYRLMQWEDGEFYLITGDDLIAVRADQPVVRIGWDEQTIVVERRDVFGIGRNGLMVITIQPKKIAEVYPLESMNSIPELARIKLIPAAEAWKRLRR